MCLSPAVAHAQVMQWLQAACLLGQAFCGPAGGASSLHRLVMQHGAASFQRMHTSNLETLHSLLERELWRSVPLPPSQSTPRPLPCTQLHLRDPCLPRRDSLRRADCAQR